MEEPILKRKLSLTDKAIRNQKKILIVSVFFIVAMFLGTSYALLTNFDKTDNVISVKTGNLSMSVQVKNESGTVGTINLDGKLPESDADGLANASPIVLTLTNTGTLNIMKYDVKLVKDTTKTSTLDYSYIKYAISLDNGVTYKPVQNLQSVNNVIYTGWDLAKTESKVIYLKVWLDEAAGNSALGKTFYGSIDLMLYQKADKPGSVQLMDAIDKRATEKVNDELCKTKVEEDGITYISGSKDCINFNYVWWSGKMWRITAIYPDGSMKMVTDNMITSIAFGENVTYYNKETQAKSYMFQWLNEDFLDALYNNGADVIDTTKSWNATMPADTTITTKPEETEATMIPVSTSSVGLLNSYEYWMSYKNLGAYNSSTAYGNSYLNIGYCWWLLNPYDSSSVWYVPVSGYVGSNSPTSPYGVRPSIYLKSGIALVGNGTKNSPYRISSDYSEATENDKVYTRHSGEYIKFDTDGNNGNYDNAPLFRIVGVEGEGDTRTTKIVAMDYADNKATKAFASTVNFGDSNNTASNDYWDYYLNNDYYDNLSFKDKLIAGNYYRGLGTSPYYNYKKSICTTDTTDRVSSCEKQASYSFMVGLLRYGELFATQQVGGFSNSIVMWLITKYSSSRVWIVSSNGYIDYYRPTNSYGVRPTYYLKSSTSILSGTGTELDPYIVS